MFLLHLCTVGGRGGSLPRKLFSINSTLTGRCVCVCVALVHSNEYMLLLCINISINKCRRFCYIYNNIEVQCREEGASAVEASLIVASKRLVPQFITENAIKLTVQYFAGKLRGLTHFFRKYWACTATIVYITDEFQLLVPASCTTSTDCS